MSNFSELSTNPDKRTYLYILTPTGFRAKSHLTYRFLQYTLDFYNQVEIKLRRRLREMANNGAEKVVLCGASEAANIVCGLNGDSISVVGVLDWDYKDSTFDGLPVFSSEDLLEADWDGVLITALSGLKQVELQLRDLGIPEEKIWRLS